MASSQSNQSQQASTGQNYSVGQSQGVSTSLGTSQSTGSSYGQGQSTSKSGTRITPGMMGVYNQLLGLNQQNYQNVLGAYNQGQQNLAQGLPSITDSYGALQGDVMNTLGMGQVLGQNGNWGVAGPAAEQIGRQFAQQQGKTTQDVTNRGLGNTSVAGNLANQNTLNAGLAYGSLGSQLAGQAAGYQSQIGQAQRGAQMQGMGMMTDLTKAGLGPLGQQYSNTAGNLTGAYGSSQSYNYQGGQQQASSQNQSYAQNQAANMSSGVNQSSGTSRGGGGSSDPSGYGDSVGNLTRGTWVNNDGSPGGYWDQTQLAGGGAVGGAINGAAQGIANWAGGNFAGGGGDVAGEVNDPLNWGMVA